MAKRKQMTDKPPSGGEPQNGSSAVQYAEVAPGWLFDVVGMNMTLAERRGFREAMIAATGAGGGMLEDERPLLPYLTRWLRGWPFAGDPGKVESYDGLHLSEWQEVIKQMVAAFQKAIA